jgi:hypothetical protein
MALTNDGGVLAPPQVESLTERGFTRRHIARMATLLTAGAAMPFYNEFAMAQDAEQRMRGGGVRRPMDPDTIRISSNENPMGPCKEGLEAIAKVAPKGWRYSPNNEQGDFSAAASEMLGVKPEYINATAGSSDPLHRSSCAFTSPTRSWVMANPGYGGGAPAFIGSKVVRVPLKDDYSHDVKAMIQADPDAGAYYVCNPNNPTGTLTTIKDIEYLLANKKKDAVVVVDEAYIHFSGDAESAVSLVAADKDVIVLRTFSKIYGMAGLRAHGDRAARPAGQDAALLGGRLPAGHRVGVRDGEHAGEEPDRGAARAVQADPRQHVLVPGKARHLVPSEPDQLLHDGSEAAGHRLRQGDGRSEDHHRTRLAGVAD